MLSNAIERNIYVRVRQYMYRDVYGHAHVNRNTLGPVIGHD